MASRKIQRLLFGLLLPGLLFATGARAGGIRWLFDSPKQMVANTHGYRDEKSDQQFWEGIISNSADPIIELNPVIVNAGKSKYLYFKLASEAGQSLQLFFSPNGSFSETLSFRGGGLENSGEPAVYRFDLSGFSLWNGAIRTLRLDVDGSRDGAFVRLYGVGVSDQPIEKVEGIAVTTFSAFNRQMDDRMAAHHETMVATDEMRPNSCISTYMNDKFSYMDSYSLAKLVAGIEVNGKTLWPASARSVRVDDIPGGVVAKYTLGGVRVTTEIVPLLIGRDTKQQDGAALYSVKTDPATPVVVRCGEGSVTGMVASRAAWLRNDEMGAEGDSVQMSGGVALLRSPRHPFEVGVKSSAAITAQTGSKGGQYASARFEKGSGALLVAYAADAQRAVELANTDPKVARAQFARYYSKLLQCRVETPEKKLDAAFRSALYNLEYNWIKPYGWNECIHHWLALWHMQHTAGAEGIGQADRSRDCNVTTAEHLLPNGAAPQFQPSGSTRRDFGGSNQFFAWQVRHYWNFTGDRKMIEQVAPKLDRVIEQTFEESDRDHDGLLAWGQQIGNQEDYVSTPFNGTTPSIEGMNMLKTAATLARALGDDEKARSYEDRASEALARLRSELWQNDLGRFAFYKDPLGMVRLDGQYHTQIYPVIWGVLDPLDSWTSMRHLRDRMIGANGECYCSNNFPNHVGGTWGMQAGAAQQPWAAWGLAAVGLRNEAYRPLKAVSEWVMNEDHRGSWPEIATEPTPAYFSPPAGLFIQSTIEALFGLEVHRPEGYLKVSPSFPDRWPSAKLNLPGFSASYSRRGNTLDYTVTSRRPLARRLRWMLPPCRITRFLVNGRKSAFSVIPGVDCVTLSANTAPGEATRFTVSIEPVKYTLDHPRSVAEGDGFRLKTTGCATEKIDDRCGLLSSVSYSGSRMTARVRQDLLKPYLPFGRLGQMNFSRRTFFLLCRAPGGVRFWAPVDFTVLPRYECAVRGEVEPVADGGSILLLVRNNSSAPLKGPAHLKAARHALPFIVDVPARSEREYRIAVPRSALALLSPGDNLATVVLPRSSALDVTLVASELFDSNPKLAAYAAGRVASVPLPETALKDDSEWRRMREFYAYGHFPWAGSRPPLAGLAGKSEVSIPGLPCVSFALRDRKMAVVSSRSGTPRLSFDLASQECKKIYLLVVPFFDNHDTFASVARVDVALANGGVVSGTLHFPGDLDWWCPREVVGDFATARAPRPDRFGLLPLLGPESGDWKEAKPPVFPRPEYWATSLAFTTSSSTLNVVEIDLGRPFGVKSVTVSTLGVDPAIGVAAVSVEKSVGQDALMGTPWMPPAEFREPKTVFIFTEAGDLKGWKTEGDAFSVAPVPSLFTAPTLNSLAKAGEAATGRAVSPDFVIGDADNSLDFVYQGGISAPADGPGILSIDLVDSTSSQTLERMLVNGSHLLRDGRMPVGAWRGRTVHLELTDRNTGSSYAWLGIQQVTLTAR
ncbi:MAG: hypothetical protein Q7T82_07235 [Armatimonadota bacterium]|nr:hypothetical protein [Armatimonadota bacterium]